MNEKPKTYIVNFYATDVNLWALTEYLHASRDIIAYWNYIPLVYCIKSYLSAAELTVRLGAFFPHPFMIVEINPSNANGMLPAEAWSWFYMDHHEKRGELPSSLAKLMGTPPPQIRPYPLPPKR